MTDDFTDAIRNAYATSRAKSARRIPTRDPAELSPEDVRVAFIMAADSTQEADTEARAHAARHGDGAEPQRRAALAVPGTGRLVARDAPIGPAALRPRHDQSMRARHRGRWLGKGECPRACRV